YKTGVHDDECFHQPYEHRCRDGPDWIAKAAQNDDRQHLVSRYVTHRWVYRVVVYPEHYARHRGKGVADNEDGGDHASRIDAHRFSRRSVLRGGAPEKPESRAAQGEPGAKENDKTDHEYEQVNPRDDRSSETKGWEGNPRRKGKRRRPENEPEGLLHRDESPDTCDQGNERSAIQNGPVQKPLQPKAKEGRDHDPRTETEEQRTGRSPDLETHVRAEGHPGGVR